MNFHLPWSFYKITPFGVFINEHCSFQFNAFEHNKKEINFTKQKKGWLSGSVYVFQVILDCIFPLTLSLDGKAFTISWLHRPFTYFYGSHYGLLRSFLPSISHPHFLNPTESVSLIHLRFHNLILSACFWMKCRI